MYGGVRGGAAVRLALVGVVASVLSTGTALFGNDSKGFNQASPSSANSGTLVIRKSNWWISSKDYGKFQVGLDGSATYHLLDDADSTQTRNVDDAEAGAVALGAFLTRT